MASTCASNVWNFFDKHEDGKLHCKDCKVTLKDFGEPTNLLTHLLKVHPQYQIFIVRYPTAKVCETRDSTTNTDADTDTTEDGTQLQSNASPTPHKKNTRQSVLSKKIDSQNANKALVKMICLNSQPLGMVENSGFKDYTYQLNQNYTLPSREMSPEELLPQQYNQAKHATNEKLQTVDFIAVSTDFWPSDDGRLFLTLTIHFIFQAKYETLTLSTKEMTGAYTAENIANKIRDALENEWKILDQVMCITTDGLPKVREAVTDILQKPHHFCVAHKIKGIFSAMTTYFFKQAVRLAYQLSDIQQLQWVSPYAMFLYLSSGENPISLDTDAKKELDQFLSVLKPLQQLTTRMSAEQYPTLSCIIPLVSRLHMSLEKINSSRYKKKLMATIDQTLDCYETNETAAKATLMDPRFKRAFFGTPEKSDSAQRYIAEELTKLEYCDEQNPLPPTSSSEPQLKEVENSNEDLWDNIDNKVYTINKDILSPTIHVQVKQYVDQPNLERKSDPLKFWEDRKTIDSGLYTMSQKYLCIPATSVPPERVFSNAGLLCKKDISRLEPDKIDQILFLNSFLSAEKE